ncbi:MAG TPA: ABC transporter substrate-binding protein [Phototrophicaceae bacterium]|nr:ABC transporter substrate-binding protein [Phototrophicaceae bacterium]
MKRLLFLVLLTSLLVVGVIPAAAQTAPTGEFSGNWPYVLPPDHTLNSFAPNGLGDNLGSLFETYVELPFAIYHWADGTYEGLLASKWGFTDDNKSYTVTIKDGAKWSDGKPVTADDVIDTFAIGRILGWTDWNYFSDIQKVDDQTIKFIFSGEPSLVAERLILKDYIASSETYGDLAKRALALVAAGKTSADDDWKALATDINNFKPDALISSGPYIYALSDVGAASMTLHWQPDSLYSSTVKFGSIKIWQGDTELSTPLVLSGEEAHSTDVFPPATIDQFKAQGIRTITIPRGYGPALLFNDGIAPWNIKEVRQAVALVINRDQNAFLTGAGATGTVYMSGLLDDNVPQLLPADVIAKLDKYSFDTDRASTLMQQAGFTKNSDGKWADKDGKTISADFEFPAEFVDFSAAAQDAIQQMNAFGFDITARAITPFSQVVTDIRSSNFSLSIWSWASQSPFAAAQFFGPLQRFNMGHQPSADQNGIDFNMKFNWNGQDIDLDDMITHASDGLDTATQQQRAGAVAQVINDEMPFIPLNVEQSVEPVNEKLISGAPQDGDPILKNPTGSDHWIIMYLLNGKLTPAS